MQKIHTNCNNNCANTVKPNTTTVDISSNISSKNSVVVNQCNDIALRKYLEISINDKIVKVFDDHIYTIEYFDTDDNRINTITGKVVRIEPYCMFVELIRAKDDTSCLCDSRYYLNDMVKTTTVCIIYSNIYSIKEVTKQEANRPPKPKERTATIVSVLGLSAEIVRSVVVRLRVYEDNRDPSYEAIPVDMKVGNVYNVSYFSRTDRVMYEVNGKLTGITLMPKFDGDTKLNGFVRDEIPVDKEVVGFNNTIYDADNFYSLDKDSTEGERIRFTFDTSDNFESYTDHVWLKDIRSVSLVEATADNENNCPMKDTCPIINKKPEEEKPDTDEHIPWQFPNTVTWDKPAPPMHYPPRPTLCCPMDGADIETCDCRSCSSYGACTATVDYPTNK